MDLICFDTRIAGESANDFFPYMTQESIAAQMYKFLFFFFFFNTKPLFNHYEKRFFFFSHWKIFAQVSLILRNDVKAEISSLTFQLVFQFKE